MICPFMSDVRRVTETNQPMFVSCEQEDCALWAHEVKGKSIPGCSILVGAGSLIAIAAMLEKNLAK